jgi:hypothetical protein
MYTLSGRETYIVLVKEAHDVGLLLEDFVCLVEIQLTLRNISDP